MVSVLIVNWNTRDLLRRCLASIEAYPPQRAYEVVVVDNASNDGSAESVAREFPWAKTLALTVNTGYARGNNTAFAQASGSYLLTLNPDTEFTDATLETSVQTLEANPRFGSLAVRLVGPDGHTQRSVRGFPTLAGLLGAATGLDRLFPRGPLGSYSLPRFDYGVEGPAPQPMGSFLLFRRSALETVGDPRKPFDEQFPIFFNEVDLLYRLQRAGWPCLYTPTGQVLHHHGASTRQVRPAMVWESHESLIRYLRKHGGPGTRLALPCVALAVRAAALVRARGVHAGFRPERDDL